jgi:hypothetical protein
MINVLFMWKDEDGENCVICENFEEIVEFVGMNNGMEFKVSVVEED